MRPAPTLYTSGSFGNFTAERYGLIGHDEADVAAWREAHPDYTGGFWFSYGDDSDDVEVTERFVDADASAWVESIRELVRGAA